MFFQRLFNAVRGALKPAVKTISRIFKLMLPITFGVASMGRLSLQMILFILGLNILQNILRGFGVIELLTYSLISVMKVFGLPESVSFLAIIAKATIADAPPNPGNALHQ